MGGTMAQPSFPVIIFETLANFFFPSLSMLISKMSVPTQTPETTLWKQEGHNTCIHEMTKFMLCFLEVFQHIMIGIVAMSPTQKGNKNRHPTH